MRSFLKQILLILISINTFAVDEQVNQLNLPELGDRVSGAVSVEQEKH